MNKSELIGAISAKADLSHPDAGRAVEALIAVVSRALKKNDKVSIVGFGTFVVRQRPAREGRNPKTQATVKIPASRNPTFKAGKALREFVK